MLELTAQDWTAILLSLRIASVATAVTLPFGIAIALFLARKDFWGKPLVDAIIYLPEFMASTIEFLGVDYHFSNIARGVIDSRDIIYFFSILGFSLYMSVISLERRKW